MDGLETATTNAGTTPQVTPAAAPTTAAPTTPSPEMPISTASSTPSKSNDDLKSILKNLNVYEVGFGILAAATLYYTIYYYKYNIYLNKKVMVDMQNKIDELTIKVSDLESVENDQTTQKQTQKKLDIFK